MFDRGGPAGVCDRVSDAAVGAEAAQRELTAGVVDLVRSGAHEIARSAVRWLILRCGLGERDARRLVRRARLLLGVPVVADRFDAGRLGVAMLDVLAGAVTPERVDVACRDAVVLCDAAETAADVAGFELVMRRWVTLADDHLACVDSAAVYDGRYCYASRSLFGSLELVARVGPDEAEVIIDALDAHTRLDRADEHRRPAQRRADALVDTCHRALTGDTAHASTANTGAGTDDETPANTAAGGDGETPADTGAGGDGHLQRTSTNGTRALGRREHVVVVTAEVLTTPSTLRPFDPYARCDLDGTPTTRNRARRLACHHPVTGATVNNSEVLDLGRSRRLPGRAIRRAMAARSATCEIGDCDTTWSHCDAHHLTHWADGGETSLDNLRWACPHHHWLLHDGGWTTRTEPDGRVTLVRPDGTVQVE